MSILNVIKTKLLSPNKDKIIYPETYTSCVYDETSGERLDNTLSALSSKGKVINGTWITRVVPANTSTKVATLTLDPTKKYLVLVNGEWVEEYEVYQSVSATADGNRILLHNGLMKYGKFSMSTIVSGSTNIALYGYVDASSGNLNLDSRTTIQAIEL